MMKLLKFDKFLGNKASEVAINENLDKSKKFLKERYVLMNAVKELGLLEGELGQQIEHMERRSVTLNDFNDEEKLLIKAKIKETLLTPDIIKSIEKDPELKIVRELKTKVSMKNGVEKEFQLDRDNIGWLSNFVYFYFIEDYPLEDLAEIYKKLLLSKDILQNLTVKVGSNFIKKQFDVNFIDESISNNGEQLMDGLDRLEESRKIKKMYDTLTPELKKSYDESSELSKEQFLSIVTGFDQQGLNSNGVVDVAKSKQLWSSFFGQMAHDTRAFLADGKTNNPNFGKLAYMSTLRRYKNIQEFIIAANGHLKSNEIDGFAAFYDLLQSTNSKLGMSGAEQVFNENGILIIEVKSFAANIMLNGHTKHCIKDVISQWDSYVGNHNNKQYYIYNFNVPLRDNYSTIGITVEPKKSIRAIHNTPDHSVTTNDFKKLLKKWEKDYNIDKDLWEYFLPMNEEEMNSKEKSKLANREIVKKGISIEEIIKYVTEDGADINKDSSKALENAVEEDDIVKSKLILDLGGLTNIKKGSEAIISKAKNIDMIKLLVERGSEMTGDVFSNVVDKLDSLQYCLKAGLDPAFNSNLPLRACFKGSYVSPSNMGSSYFDSFNVLIEYIKKTNQLDSIKQKGNMIVKWAAEFGRVEILKEFKKIGIFDNFNEADWKSVISWVGISRKASEESKAETKKYLESIR